MQATVTRSAAGYIALLRGINLGPSRRVSMSELREHLAGAGYGDVRTYLQSGNVLLASELAPDALARELERQIANRFALSVDVVVRTREELAEIVARNPLAAITADPKRYQVTFLASEPSTAIAERITGLAVAPEAVVVAGREIFAWHPEGVARSKLALALADRRLGIVATARNWNTVTNLLALATDG
jgi:uncharacterized protein (DUF1697 family)